MPKTFHDIPRQRPATPLLDQAATPAELRRLSEAELEQLADELRQELLYCVGSYRLEGMGSQLFDKVDGDYFTVLGMTLWLVLEQLRRFEVLPR